jgi:AhpD family alkylhydroperoxidase
MMFDWNDYKNQLVKSIPEFAKLSPDSLKGYQTLSAANSEHSLLGAKVRELISLAVAVTTRCDGCITFHTEAALKAGASKEEISEALGVAMAMNAGAALVFSLRAMDAVAAKTGQQAAAKG